MRIGRSSVATVVPATFQLAERPRAASVIEYLRPGVAHEDERLSARAQVEGQEAGTGERAGEREREHRVARVDRHCVDCKEGKGDRSQARGEPVHVVEEVERVRHADEPQERERPGKDLRVDQLDVGSGRQHEDRRSELDGELAERRQRMQVVDHAGDEEQRDPAVDAGDLAGRGHRADGDGEPQSDGDAGEDPDPAEKRRGALVPAVGRRRRDQALRDRRAQQDPNGESGGGESGEGREGAHVVEGSKGVLGRCLPTSGRP